VYKCIEIGTVYQPSDSKKEQRQALPIQMQWYDKNFANWQPKRDLKRKVKRTKKSYHLMFKLGETEFLTRH